MQIDRIKAATVADYGISLTLLNSKNKERRVAHPRMVAMTLARELTPRSLPEIGRQFGRDHTTVINAIRRVNGVPMLRARADKIAHTLGSSPSPDWRKLLADKLACSIVIASALRGFA